MKKFLPLLASFFLAVAVLASPDDRTVTLIQTTPDNTFDNLVAGDSVGIRIDVSGGAVAAESPDDQGGVRVEFYNSGGSLVRRRFSIENDADPTATVYWNGQGDNHVSDTLAYGSYTLRAYQSMRDPTFTASISGTDLVVDRPGDLHVTSGGVLTWTNTGSNLGFLQVSLGDPNTASPTLLRRVDFPSGFGSANTDQAYGVVFAGNLNAVFVSDNQNGGVAGVRIAKYSTASETWTTLTWATAATTSVSDDEWYGLGLDDRDEIYVAMGRAVAGGGGGGTFEGVVRLTGTSTSTAEQTHASADQASDYYDVAPYIRTATDSGVYIADYQGTEIDTENISLNLERDPKTAIGSKSVWALPDGGYYASDDATDAFYVYDKQGNLRYSLADARIDGASGIAVWQKNSTSETFILVGGQNSHKIAIYSENAAADSATFVRVIEEDVNYLNNPIGLAILADSAIVVVSRGTDTVKQFSKDGVFANLTGAANGKWITGTDATSTLTDTRGFQIPGAVAVDASGNIYVFDQENLASASDAAIKRFSPSGAPDASVWYDLDANVTGGAWSGEITMATIADGVLYGASRENDARVFRIDIATKAAVWIGGASTPSLNKDVLALSVAPHFDRTNNVFYPSAVHIMTDQGKIRIYTADLATQIGGEITPANAGIATPSNVSQPFLVDDFGELYTLIDDGTSTYTFRRHNAQTAELAMAANGLSSFAVSQGSGSSNLNAPRQAVWVDADGNFVYNPATQRYEQSIWINDSVNNRLQKMLLAWNDVEETPIIITENSDTPVVISASVTGNTVATIGGLYYVGQDTITVQINFNNTLNTVINTNVVSVKPNGGSFTPATQVSYGGSVWAGTFVITPGMSDGDAEIQVENFFDQGGTIRKLDPNPDQTDFDGSDDFKKFVIDKTAPTGSVSDPADSTSTSSASYTVAGTISTEATGLDATVVLSIYTAQTGGVEFDSATVVANAGNGAFSTAVDLQSPAPSDNWLEVVAVDDLGNRASLFTPRRNISRTVNRGSGLLSPDTTHVVGSLDRYVVKYTAAQNLVSDTIRFTIPANWSDPHDNPATNNGFVTITTSGSYGDSVIDLGARTITCTGVSLSIGGTLSLVYGDSVVSPNGRAGPSLDAPLATSSNLFPVEVYFAGTDTAFVALSTANLAAPLKDSSVSAAVFDTGPGIATLAEVAKGEETRVMRVRVTNTNLGNHTNKITQIALSVESNTGGVVAWNHVASRVIAKNTDEGIEFANVTTMPAGANLTLPLTGFTVGQNLSRDMEFLVTFSTSASADTVRFYLNGPSALTAIDSVSSNALTVFSQETGVTSVRRTGNYDIIGLNPAETCAIGFTDPGAAEAATGQQDVTVMRLIFENRALGPETPVNQARIDRVVLQMRRADGTTALNGNAVLSGLAIVDEQSGTQYGGVTPGASETLTLDLSGFTLTSGESRTVIVYADIAANTSTTSAFRLGLDAVARVTAKDKITNLAMTVIDPADLSGTLPYLIDTVVIVPKGRATLERITLLRTDSSVIDGVGGAGILVGDVFYAALRIRADAGRGSVRLIPNDTDLVLRIDGTVRTSEFTITKPPAKTIGAGTADTIIYGIIQDLGSTYGTLAVANDTASGDSRPRAFDAHDYFAPDQLQAVWVDGSPETVAVNLASIIVAAGFALDTSFANAGETAVPVVKFQVTNNSVGGRQLDSVVVEGLSIGGAVTNVRIYHDARTGGAPNQGTLNPATDTLVASGAFGAADTVLFILSPKVGIPSGGGAETIFVAYDFATTLTDGDTVDARIPPQGIRVLSETLVPAVNLNSSGEARIEIVASRLTTTPESQAVAKEASPTVTLRAVDRYDNIDAVVNSETSTQGHNRQMTITFTSEDADTTHHITGTSGLTNVTPAAGLGVTQISARLSSGQGSLTLYDTEAEKDTLAISSGLTDSTARISFDTAVTASGVNLTGNDSATPDSDVFLAMKFRVSNAMAVVDTVTYIQLQSLNTADTHLTGIQIYKDLNGNGLIDTGADQLLASDTDFSAGLIDFTGLSIPVPAGDSVLFLVSYEISTSVADNAVVDARVPAVTTEISGPIVTNALESTPNRRIDVRAIRIAHSPTTSSQAIGSNRTVDVSAVDAFGNVDVHYSGGTGITWDLTGSALFQSSTLLNEDIDPLPDPPFDNSQVKGNLSAGAASITFTDLAGETTFLSVVTAPGLSGTHDTGSHEFQDGFAVTAVALYAPQVNPAETNVVLLHFNISATATQDTVTDLLILWRGTSTGDVVNCRLYHDADDDDTFTAAGDVLFGANPAAFVGETLTFSGGAVFVPNGGDQSFFLVVDLPETAVIGDTLDAALSQGGVLTSSGRLNVPPALRNSSGHDTIVEGLFADSIAISPVTVAPGAQNLLVGHVRIINNTKRAYVLTSCTTTNVGTHPDLGINRAECFIDAEPDGTGDTEFGAGAVFVSGVRNFTGTYVIPSQDTVDLHIRFDLSDTLAVDSKTLDVEIAISGILFATGETLPKLAALNSGGAHRVVVGIATVDSIAITGSEGVADGTPTTILVTVVDTEGVPAVGRSVSITGDTGNLVFVTSHPAVTDNYGHARFSVKTDVAGSYIVSASIDGVPLGKSATVSFLARSGVSGDNLGGNPASNDLGEAATGWVGPPVWGRIAGDADEFAYLRATSGGSWSLVHNSVGGAPSAILTTGEAVGMPNFLGTVRFQNLYATGGDSIVYAGIDDLGNFRGEIYAVGQDGSGQIRISPDDPRDTDPGNPSDDFTDVSWYSFDFNPADADSMAVSFAGNLAVVNRQGASWSPNVDSAGIYLLTSFSLVFNGQSSPMATDGQILALDPAWSPDGSRIAFTIHYVSSSFPFGAASRRAEIWVLKDFGSLNSGYFGDSSVSSINDTTHAKLVRVTHQPVDGFCWRPRWNRDGTVLMYSQLAEGEGSWDFQNIFSDYPYNSNPFSGTRFKTMMKYYDVSLETSPYAAIEVVSESGVDAPAVSMSNAGTTRLAYVRQTSNTNYEVRTVTLSPTATINASGGILLDSGVTVAVVPDGENLALGTRISSALPETTPGAQDPALFITGAAKEFFSADSPTLGVAFSESVTVFLHYTAADIPASQLVGFDDDADGIPDRTEASLGVYYWNGTTWEAFNTIRHPSTNRLEFQTSHFSLYAAGISTAQTYTGSVQNAVVFPNPWRIDGVGTATAGLSPSNTAYGVKIDRLPSADVGFQIFTLAGQKVIEATLNTSGTATAAGGHLRSLGDGRVSWDLRNQHGREVASGIYLMVITGPGGTATRKVAVIR